MIESFFKKKYFFTYSVSFFLMFLGCKEEDQTYYFKSTFVLQQRLDNGETPNSIWKSENVLFESLGMTEKRTMNNNLLDSLFGLKFQGGLIADFNPSDGTGLLVSPSDLPVSDWGCVDSLIRGSSSTLYGYGMLNTLNIYLGCSDKNSAAAVCHNLTLDGYSDWFLPSLSELQEVFENLEEDWPKNEAGKYNKYWTSSQIDDQNSFSQELRYASRGGTKSAKSTKLSVRAVRYF